MKCDIKIYLIKISMIEIKGNLRIKIDQKNDTASVYKSPEVSGHVFIPHFVEHENKKYKIISIGEHAFNGCKIDSLTFSKDTEVETFEKYCFFCAHIKTLEIPASIKNLQYEWCYELFDLVEIRISPNNRHFIMYNNQFLLGKISDSSDKFDVLHFALYNVEEAVIPAQVSVVKSLSFSYHNNLKSIKFSPNSELKHIEDYALKECSIESLSLPASVEHIGSKCFSFTPNLREIEISPKNKKFKLIDGKYIVKESEAESCVFDVIIFARRDIEKIRIPSHIKIISNSAFQNCNRLKTVTFEDNSSLEIVKSSAFSFIQGPERLVLPPSLKKAGCCSFSHIQNTKLIEFLGKSIKIGYNCFIICDNLINVTFPNADEITFSYNPMQFTPKSARILVKSNAKLSFFRVTDGEFENRISYIEYDTMETGGSAEKVTPASEGSEELGAKLQKAEEEISKLKEVNTKLKEDNTKLRRKIKEIDSKNGETSSTIGGVTKLELFDPEGIDALKVVRTIGRGGQSEVFEVTREQHLALKVLFIEGVSRNGISADSSSLSFKQLQRFLQEYEILSSLHHANIVKTFGFCYGDASHAPSILLELCEKNLRERISLMDDIDKVCCIIEISQAMESVHAARMIHRDLKPENVLFDSDGHVRISDFGVACIVDVEGQTQSMTSCVGTLKFMAPELLNESTTYDNKVDIYSFGVVLFFILSSGMMPKISIAEQSCGKKAQIPSCINKVSHELISACWSTSPSDRPSFTEILSTIKKSNFRIIDGVEKKISAIKDFVKL